MKYPRFLPDVYRFVLRLTNGRGSHVLARLDATLFPTTRNLAVGADVAMELAADPHLFGYLLGTHEGHVKQWITDVAGGGARSFVDIGANIGYFTGVALAFLSPGSWVCAVEPDAENFAAGDWMETAAAQRGINLLRIPCAVSEEAGQVFLERHPKFCTYHRVSRTPPEANSADRNRLIEITAITLPEIAALAPRGEIDCLKVDVEGHEAAVFRGGAELFAQRKVRAALVEVTPGDCARTVFQVARAGAYRQRFWAAGQWLDWQSPESLTERTDVWLEA